MPYETVHVYSEKHNMTIRIPATPQLTTVLEFERWAGTEVERDRLVVLLDCNMNESLRVQADLLKGDRQMLQALFDVIHFSDTYTAILGYDFFCNKPRIALYARTI